MNQCDNCRYGKRTPIITETSDGDVIVGEGELVCTKPDFSRSFYLKDGFLKCRSREDIQKTKEVVTK